MFGPAALATPHAHIAHDGSFANAALNARAASSWLKAYDCSMPRRNSSAASGEAVTTDMPSVP